MDYKYDVFISYKHSPLDMAVSGHLQKILEHYRVPREIQKKGKKHLSRVFRDNEELAAGVDLNAEISEQLEQSEFLMVICSPDSAGSPWVEREINTFITYHGTKNIIPILIQGEPDEAFPQPLKEIGEPLAVDIREKQNGGTSEVLKNLKKQKERFLAPVLYCSYDELKQRHKAYLYRRIALAAAAVLLLASGFGVYAFSQYLRLQTAYQDIQYKESHTLTLQAFSALEENDPIGAAEYALEALNGGSSDFEELDASKLKDGTYDKGAQLALSKALGCYADQDSRANSLQVVKKITFPENIDCDKYFLSRDGSMLLAIGEMNLYVYRTSDGQLLHTIKLVSEASDLYTYISTNDDLFTLVGDSEVFLRGYESLFCVDYVSGRILWKEKLPDIIETWRLSEDQTRLFCCTGDRFYTIDMKDGSLSGNIPLRLPEEYGESWDFQPGSISADGSYLMGMNSDYQWIILDMDQMSFSYYPLEEQTGDGSNKGKGYIWVDDQTLFSLFWQEKDGKRDYLLSFRDVGSQAVIWSKTLETDITQSQHRSFFLTPAEDDQGNPYYLLALENEYYLMDLAEKELVYHWQSQEALEYIFCDQDTKFYAASEVGTLLRGNYTIENYKTIEDVFLRDAKGLQEKDDRFYLMDSSKSKEVWVYEMAAYDENYVSAVVLPAGYLGHEYYSFILTEGPILAYEDGLAIWCLGDSQLILAEGNADPVCLPLFTGESDSSSDYHLLGIYENGVYVSKTQTTYPEDGGVQKSHQICRVDLDSKEAETIDSRPLDDSPYYNFKWAGNKVWSYGYGDGAYGYLVYDFLTGETIQHQMAENESIDAGWVSPDGSKAIFADSSELWLYVVNQTGEETGRVDLTAWTRDAVNSLWVTSDRTALTWSSDSSRFAVKKQDGIALYDTEGNLIKEISAAEIEVDFSNLVDCFFSEDNSCLYLMDEKNLSRYDLAGDSRPETIQLQEDTLSPASSHDEADGTMILVAGDSAYVIDTADQELQLVDYVPYCYYYDPIHSRFYYLTAVKYDDQQNTYYELQYYQQYSLGQQIQMGRALAGGQTDEN